MPSKRVDVARLLSELRNKYGDTVKVEDVAKVVGTLLASSTGEMAGVSRKIYSELESLNRYIQSAKAEISALRPEEVTDEFLPTATSELDAIVAATAEATNTIMDATEVIEGVADALEGDHQNSLMDATTNIYEACGFQDITGQRITKVVNTLKEIEDKVDALVSAFGDKIEKVSQKVEKENKAAAAPEKLSDADLLAGPQMGGEGISQEEIDRLLADFD